MGCRGGARPRARRERGGGRALAGQHVCASSDLPSRAPPLPPLQRLLLERPLPFHVRPEYKPQLLPRTGSVYESGVEGGELLCLPADAHAC